MEAKAVARHIRIAPRKIRIVADLVRGKNIGEAFACRQCRSLPRRSKR